jgi:parallel beta-helix repeat protein
MLLATSLAIPALAGDGRIPIHRTPLTIDQPGSYFLTQDITQTVSSDGNFTNIAIHNGRLRGGNIGIRLRNTVGDDFMVRIRDMTLEGSLNEAIYVQGQSLIGSSQVLIENNSIHDSGNDGIGLRFMWGGRVSGNVVQGAGDGSGDHGIYLHSCRGVTVSNNTVSHSGADGIRIWYSWYCAVDGNHTTYNNDWGVNVYQGDQIVYSGNRAYGNGAGGLTIPGGEGHVNAGGNYPAP